jgi:hypothetical protein
VNATSEWTFCCSIQCLRCYHCWRSRHLSEQDSEKEPNFRCSEELLAMKLIIPITYLLMGIAACTSVWLVSTLKPASISAFVFFIIWSIFPYAMISAALMFFRAEDKHAFHWYVVAIIISTGGVLFLADVIFWHPDAQGAIAVLMAPIIQGGALVLLSTVVWWVSRNARPIT